MNRKTNLLFLGLPLSYVAKATKLPATTVWRHATGARKVSPELAIQYSRSLGVPLSKIRPDLWPPEPAPSVSE